MCRREVKHQHDNNSNNFFSLFDFPKKAVIQRIWRFVSMVMYYVKTLWVSLVQSGCVSKLSRLKRNWTCALTCLSTQMHVRSRFVIAFRAFRIRIVNWWNAETTIIRLYGYNNIISIYLIFSSKQSSSYALIWWKTEGRFSKRSVYY